MTHDISGTTTTHTPVCVPLPRAQLTIPDAVISIKGLDRCAWAIGCPNELESARYLQERLDDTDYPIAMDYPDQFMELFPGTKRPDIVAVSCYSLFTVLRQRIHDRPIEVSIRYRNWLLNTTLPTDVSRTIFKYAWHSMLLHLITANHADVPVILNPPSIASNQSIASTREPAAARHIRTAT